MHSLGQSRSAHRDNHILHTPDAFVRAPWPGMKNATAIVHAAPRMGAGFTQYSAEFEVEGYLPASPVQRFVYVISGEVRTGTATLGPGEYAYFGESEASQIESPTGARAVVIEKPYQTLSGVLRPSAFTGQEGRIAPSPLMGDPDLEVRSLIPAEAAFDFAVNTMTFQPGATLPLVEVHVMEHGLIFLEGGGIYRLGDCWYPVTEGDFIYMAPYCPQWFGALGKKPAKYLIYKDWNRAA